jgi:hypothetical protein
MGAKSRGGWPVDAEICKECGTVYTEDECPECDGAPFCDVCETGRMIFKNENNRDILWCENEDQYFYPPGAYLRQGRVDRKKEYTEYWRKKRNERE